MVTKRHEQAACRINSGKRHCSLHMQIFHQENLSEIIAAVAARFERYEEMRAVCAVRLALLPPLSQAQSAVGEGSAAVDRRGAKLGAGNGNRMPRSGRLSSRVERRTANMTGREPGLGLAGVRRGHEISERQWR
jgi:hypothetical protein